MGLLKKASARRISANSGLRFRAEEIAKQSGYGSQHHNAETAQCPEKKKTSS